MRWSWPPKKTTPSKTYKDTKSRDTKSAALIALSHIGAAQWGPSSGRALMQDGYLRNAVAYRCVRMLAEAGASLPFITRHKQASALLRRPLPDMNLADMLTRAYTQLHIYGNAYFEGLDTGTTARPSALQPLHPTRMQAKLDGQGWIASWQYTLNHRVRLIPRQSSAWLPILHLKLFHPGDDIYGLPALAPARQALDLHNASADWAKALIDNSAKPSGALVYGTQGGHLTDAQFQRLKEELDAAHTGAGNAGRPLLLEGGLDWKPMSLSPADMDFREARNGAAREIALTLGVPPQLLGIPGDNTYANYKEANLAFWRMSVIPLAQRTARAFSLWLSEAYGEDVEISCDLDAVPALASEQQALWARVGSADFLTEAEKRSLLNIETRLNANPVASADDNEDIQT